MHYHRDIPGTAEVMTATLSPTFMGSEASGRQTRVYSSPARSMQTVRATSTSNFSQRSHRSSSPSSSTHAPRTSTPERERTDPDSLNPYHTFAASSSGPPQEVHVLKVTGDTVYVSPGPPRQTLLDKVGGSLARNLPRLSPADGPMSPPGPPPPSPPASVEERDHILRSESPAQDENIRTGPPIVREYAKPDVDYLLPGAPLMVFSKSEPVQRADCAESSSRRRLASTESRDAVCRQDHIQESQSLPSSPRPPPPAMRPVAATLPPPVLHRAASETRSLSASSSAAARACTTDTPHASSSGTTPTDGTSVSVCASGSGVNPAHMSVDGYLQPPPPVMHRPTRRNTTGSAPSRGSPRLAHTRMDTYTPGVGLGEESADGELASDIQQQAEQIRRERQTKRARAQQAAEAALTRSASRRSTKDEQAVLVGNLIGEDHVNYVLMYNMLTGIRIAVSRCQAKIKRPLTDEDFAARHKYSFDIIGNELTPSARYDFKFKDYAPWVFRELREDYFHLDPADYLLSLTAKYILSELGSPGKSGSFFYFSRDYRFIIKTIHHSEHKFLRSILKSYYTHVKSNPHTLLSRFYGLHRVKLPRGRKIHFVIMNNLFPPHKDIHETYDLKGSTVGREYNEERAAANPRAVLKDLNWINRGKSLEFGPEKRALLTEQLRRDSELLKQLHVMDYSLLVGIHNVRRGNRDNVRRDTLKVFSPDMPNIRRKQTQLKGSTSPEAIAMRRAMRESDPKRLEDAVNLPEEDPGDRQHYLFYQDDGGLRATDEADTPSDKIYYLGVIDILTPYNVLKRLEHFWKGLKADRHKISPVPPSEYGDRFFAFMKAIMRGGGGGESFKERPT